jgi:tetratricopeptide (TPR) repeat protein
VLDGLTALVDKSLLVLVGERFGMLETIRAYGLERLKEAGEHERLVRAHTAYFLELAERAEPHLRQAAQLTWLARLTEDDDNLVSAVRRTIAAGDGDTATRFIAALGWYWWLRGHRMEGGDLAAAALPLSDSVDPERRAIAYAYAGLAGADRDREPAEVMSWFATALELAQGFESSHPILRIAGPIATLAYSPDRNVPDAELRALQNDTDPWTRSVGHLIHAHLVLNRGLARDDAEHHFRRSLAGFTDIGERWGMAFTLTALAEMQSRAGEHRGSIEHYERALVFLDDLGATEDRPMIEVNLATQYLLVGERDKADAMMDQAARTADRVGARNEIGYVLHGRAEFARHDGDPERALMLCQRARAYMDEQQVAPQLLAIVASGIGLAQAACGDLHAARASHLEALVHAEASHDAPVLGRVLDGFADLALAEGDPARAAELLAAATAVRGGPDAGQLGPARTAAAAHRALGDHRFAEATARGAATAYHNLTPASPAPTVVDQGSLRDLERSKHRKLP